MFIAERYSVVTPSVTGCVEHGNHNPGVGGSSPSPATNRSAGTNSPNSSIKSINIALRVGVDVSCVTGIAHTEGVKFWLVQHSSRGAKEDTCSECDGLLALLEVPRQRFA